MRWAALAAGLLAAAFPPWALASERNAIIETIQRVSSSVGALYAQESGGNIKFLCTITAVGKENGNTVLLTANHCLSKGVAYLVNFGDNKLRSATVWKVPHYDVDKQKFPRRYNEPETDMALFVTPGSDIPIVNPAPNGNLPIGSKIVMVGFPLGVAKISYEGTVAGFFDRPGSDVSGYLLLQIFGAPGSSGSAVVSADSGEIVGIMVAGQSSSFGLPVLFATPIQYQEHLMLILPKQ